MRRGMKSSRYPRSRVWSTTTPLCSGDYQSRSPGPLGIAPDIFKGVPIYMGAATSRILTEAAFWTMGWTVEPAGFLEHREPFTLGPFRITPYLNDHSVFDAYSLLVEAGGKSLFYTGDIRGHGRKSGIFEQLLRHPPEGVDVLLMEGTKIANGVIVGSSGD